MYMQPNTQKFYITGDEEVATSPSPRGTSSSSRSPSRSGKRRQLVRIVIIDRSALFRAGLVHILAGSRFRVTANCSSLSDLSENVLGAKHSVLLISLDEEKAAVMPQVVSLTERGLRVIVLTEQLRPEELVAAITAGAAGYLLKNEISPDVLVRSLELVLQGGVIIPQGFKKSPGERARLETDAVPAIQVPETASEGGQPQPASDAAQTDDVGRLSNREQTVLMQLTHGASNKHIARELNIAEATVKIHVKSLLSKIRVNNRTQAAMWAMNRIRPNGLGH
jgi:two-component system nitrate/nitrite response regulator NarL